MKPPKQRARRSEAPASGVHPTAAPAEQELRLEDRHPEYRTIPEIGTSPNDLAVVVLDAIQALGVNNPKPDAATILAHTIGSELPAIDLVLRNLDALELNGIDVSREAMVLSGVRERLAFVSECAGTLAALIATAKMHGGAT